MYNIEEEWQYEEKMDQIVVEMEELILEAFLAVLKKIRQRNEEFNQIKPKPNDDMQF